MKPLHLDLQKCCEALQWADKQADSVGARGHVGTHLDCYSAEPDYAEYELTAMVLDCESAMPSLTELCRIETLQDMACVLHTKNLETNQYATEAYFSSKTFLTEESLFCLLSKKPKFILIDSHGIAEKGIRHISFDKLCEQHGCHVIENVDLHSVNNGFKIIRLRIIIDMDIKSTGKPCQLYLL